MWLFPMPVLSWLQRLNCPKMQQLVEHYLSCDYGFGSPTIESVYVIVMDELFPPKEYHAWDIKWLFARDVKPPSFYTYLWLLFRNSFQMSVMKRVTLLFCRYTGCLKLFEAHADQAVTCLLFPIFYYDMCCICVCVNFSLYIP